ALIELQIIFFCIQCHGQHRDLHSFPTRRSSDLPMTGLVQPSQVRIEEPGRTRVGLQAQAPEREGAGVHSDLPRFRGQSIVPFVRSEEHTSELQSPCNLVCRLLLEKKKKHNSISR